MSMTELNLSFPTEKLDALRFFMDKKQQSVEQKLQDYLDKTYEKLVPAQVREYVESRMEPASAPRQESPVPARERPAHQPRRSRQAASEAAPVPETPSEPAGPDEQENQGITLSM
jgi:hypothetical protein